MNSNAVVPEEFRSEAPLSQRTSRGEVLIFAGGALLLLVVEALTNSPAILFGRYLYLDELRVKFIDSNPSVWRSLVELEHSGDFTPPVYHILVRIVWWLVGGSGEVAFRALALAGMWVALTLLYVLLRRAFGVLPTLVAVLALWSNPLIIHYAFFARPYALLLAATIGFCLAYDSIDSTLRSKATTAAAAATPLHDTLFRYFRTDIGCHR